MNSTVVYPHRFSNILPFQFFLVLFCVIFVPSIRGQNTNNEYDSEIVDKKSGARPFINPNDKRGGGRYFQLKRGGARSFSEPIDADFYKRGGARGFANSIDLYADKRGGGRGFLAPIDSDVDKRAGGRGFVIPLADKREDWQDVERRAGARAFSMPVTDLDKRGGARPFIAAPEWKRAGGRSFSSFYQGGTMKRGGGRAFLPDDMDKRGGGRAFLPDDVDKRGGGRGFLTNDDFDKRGGGRSFYGHGRIAMRNFYGGGGFPYAYEKKASNYIPYDIDNQIKRGGGRAFGASNAWSQPWYAEKRAGGRTFPIDDMDDSKEKRMIDEMSRFYS